MSPSLIALIVAVVFVVVLIVVVDKNSARRDKENADLLRSQVQVLNDQISSLNTQIQKKDRELAAIKFNIDQTNEAVKKTRAEAFRNTENLSSKVDNSVSTLTSVVDSLNTENHKLRAALDEQKERLDFYLNIDKEAGKMTVDEDSKEREELLAKVKAQIAAQQGKTQSGADKGKGQAVTTQPSSGTPIAAAVQSRQEELEPEIIPSGERILDDEQEFARNYMESTSKNVFITGKAGTGKSFLLNVFRDNTAKGHIVLAPTGIAALNVDGATLHSTFGYSNLVNLDVDEISDDTIKLKSEKKMVLRRVSTIIIDEISMVRADTFDKIDRILKVINKSSQPFGGKQMLLFGDLFQLPPVTKGKEMDYLLDRYGGTHFFHSDAYKAGDFKFIELTKNHRQKGDREFFEVLNRIREGKTTVDDIDLLNTRYTPDESKYDHFVSLFPTKAEAERVNTDHINQLESREYVYYAETVLDKRTNKNKSFDSIFPIANVLRLKVGASVMMVANDPEHRWVNGSLGIVKELDEDHISVSFGENRVFDIMPCQFDEQEITYSNGKIVYEKILCVVQYPVVPAYAITIHKSQGQTYSQIACDIDRCFASGQAYVALSRCASLDGLHLKSLITPASIKVDRDVLGFYRDQIANNVLGKR